MTSPSRRKRQITASKIQPRKNTNRRWPLGGFASHLVLAGVALVLIAVCGGRSPLHGQQAEPPRFAPPVHAQPLPQAHTAHHHQPRAHQLRAHQSRASTSQPRRANRMYRVRQVSGVQELATQQHQQPPPAASSVANWRSRNNSAAVQDHSTVQPGLQSPVASPINDNHVPNQSSPAETWSLSDVASDDDDLPPILEVTPGTQYPDPLIQSPPAQYEAPNPVGDGSAPSQPLAQAEESVLTDIPFQNGRGDAVNQLRVEPQRMAPNSMRPRSATPARYRARQDFSANNDNQDQSLGAQPDYARGLKSCDDYRSELLDKPITSIIVDASPIKPEPQTQVIPEGMTRTWTDCQGNTLGSGTLVELQRSYIVITNDAGQQQRISLARLSDSDLAVVTQYWGLPTECSLGCYSLAERNWMPNTLTWTASSLCHKPLYFENRQLERYGHTHGPVLQPLHSTAHFFVRIVGWPYLTGIHPTNECVYALGYYRPGNCAPWLREPLPISLSGTARQTGFILGTAAILP